MRISQLTCINVEHFEPHRGNLDLKYDWNNLFLACYHCNHTKSDDYFPLLNPLDSNDRVLEWIECRIHDFPKAEVEFVIHSPDSKTYHTATLLNAVHKGTTARKMMEAGNLCRLIQEETLEFEKLLSRYPKADTETQRQLKEKIREKLAPESRFTAFKIWIIKRNARMREEFADCLEWINDFYTKAC